MGHRVALFLLLVLGLSWAPAFGDAFGEGMNFYRQKNYIEAAAKLNEAAQADPKNAATVFQAAYATYYATRKDEAIEIFWYVAKNCPTSKQAASSREILKKIDPKFLIHQRDAAIGAKIPRPPGVAAPAEPVGKRKHSNASKRRIIDELVKLTPRRSNRPDVAISFITEIKDGLMTMPYEILRFLQENKCDIVVTPCVVEADFRMEKYQPGGYREGSTMEDVPALFDGSRIVVGQFISEKMRENPGIVGTLRHEVGHAVDMFSGQISQKEEFSQARVWDYPGAKSRDQLAYFIGRGRGDAEAFAELCCYKLGGRTDENRAKSCALLQRSAVKSYPIVEKAIEQIEAEYNTK